ncbi:MAG: hypothetical protein QOD06_1952 [Candidatus Binatota bacterium]|jgi:hypothetical protein|nr:hypothetical protein [Candidatus Binatota bacterium]
MTAQPRHLAVHREAFPLCAFHPGHAYKVIGKWMIRHPLKPAPIMRW